MGKGEKIPVIKKLVRKHNVGFVGLVETKHIVRMRDVLGEYGIMTNLIGVK